MSLSTGALFFHHRAHMKPRGFTLVELLVTIALIGIVTSLAAPSFNRTIKAGRISSAVNTFLADMRFARSEAIRRGGNVVVCRSDAPESATPACGAGAGTGAVGWASGWFVFHDANGDGLWTAEAGSIPAETILRVQEPTTAIDAIVDSGSSTKFRFSGTGRLYGLSAATSVHFGTATFSQDLQRVVCINVSGRARVAGNGSATCGADN
jgi:type IV fimbrial biogenesis protein FimT